MNKKDKIKLDVMSNIDDEIVDHVTKKRFRLSKYLQKRPIWMKKGFYISAVAALLLLSIGIFFAVRLFGKQVPIYRGMTVSSTVPSASTASADDPALPSLLLASGEFSSYLADHKGSDKHDVDQDDPFGHGKDKDDKDENGKDENGKGGHGIEEAIKDSLHVQGPAAELYYGKPNEDVYITIHIDNPDNFEILSFTLNGNKYSSYMFEDGSDMENLILKVNVGDVSGVVEFTIDAIKYVDGTAIKDVRMEGERTVRVGIYTENQPVATVQNEVVGFDKLSFEVTLSDVENLITNSAGKVQAVLYDGETLIATQDVHLDGRTTVRFEGLHPDTLYQYAVVATYDALDGKGFSDYILCKKALYTEAILAYDAVTVSQSSISFRLDWSDGAADRTLTGLTLWCGEEKVRDLGVGDTRITGLRSNTDYTLVATYLYKGISETQVLEFHTRENAVPSISPSITGQTQTGFSFDLGEVDVDNVGAVLKIELLHGDDDPIVVESPDMRTFSGLLSGHAYRVRITYVYDLNDGSVAQKIVKTLNVRTVAKTAPSVRLNKVNTTEYTIGFDVVKTDPDAILELLRVELSLNGAVVASGAQLEGHSYKDLAPNAVYTVTVYYAYDLNDGNGRIQKQYTQTIKTASVVMIQGITYQLHDDKTATVIGTDANITEPTFVCVDGYVITEIGASAFSKHPNLTTVTIPATVKTISASAFANCEKLVSVNLPSTLTAIGDRAFYGCEKLTEIVLPEGVKTIGSYAFSECIRLASVKFPSTLTAIGASAFKGCEKLTAIVLPESLTAIGNYAFAECVKLTAVKLPSTLTRIGSYAFFGCSELREIVISKSVEVIGEYAFECPAYVEHAEKPANWSRNWSCTPGLSSPGVWNFKEIYIDAQGIRYALCNDGTAVVIGYTEDVSTDVVLTLDGYTVVRLLTYALSEAPIQSIVIPNTVTIVENYALQLEAKLYIEAAELPEEWCEEWNYWGLRIVWNFKEFYTDAQGVTYALLNDNTAIVIGFDDSTAEVVIGVDGYTVTEIAGRAFEESKNLIRIVLPEGLKIIGERAFANCSKLTSVNLPSTLTELGTGAFTACSKLTGITVPAGVKVIPNDAFSWCNDLRDVVFSEGLETICEYAFLECRNISVLVIPQSVTRIEAHAFSGTYGTKICAKAESEPSGWQAHWDYDVMLAVWNIKEIYVDDQGITYALRNDGTAAVVDCVDSATLEIELAVNGYVITEICPRALEGYGTMTSITIPKTVTLIGTHAFDGCWELAEIRFDGTVAEWNAIEKEDEWTVGMHAETCVVHCSDGTVGI